MGQEDLCDSRLLLVDDEIGGIRVLERILRKAGFDNCRSTTDARQVPPLFSSFRPDLVLLDLHMPHMDGFSVISQLVSRVDEREYLPILVISGDITPQAKQRALSLGAKDFLGKPFDELEVLLRMRNLLNTRFLHLRLQDQNRLLEERVRERTAQLERATGEILERLALASEYRDDETGEHIRRVGELAARLAHQLGLPESEVDLIRRAAPLHDVGKIGVPDAILLKPGRLTEAEFERMKCHTVTGGKILSGSRSPLLQMAEEIALYHHERWDGTGYAGVEGESIPLVARIVALVDVFDALAYERPYKRAWSLEETLAEVRRQTGRHFDPQVVDALLQLLEPARGDHVTAA
jgi:putative two-component system response regulator